MSKEGGSQADRDLLARLNALKKTHIDLDDKQYRVPVTAHIQSSTDPSPAKALHNDLASRFQSLSGKQSKDQNNADGPDGNKDDPLAEEDSKTIEELLDELGGEGAWNFEKDEATQIDDLLRSANVVLKDVESKQEVDEKGDMIAGNDTIHNLPSIDVELSRPDPDPEDDDNIDEHAPRKSKKELEAEIDHEADDIIATLKDELKNAPPEPESDDAERAAKATGSHLPSAPAFDLPTSPSKEPEPQFTSAADNDLASRFASLGLPSAPSTTLPSAPTNKPTQQTKFGSTSRYGGHTDEEIDSWCVICLEDATLRCIGCDGDLYCAKCWLEGHHGPDAGYEEKKHKAVEYNKGVKKEPRRRIAAQ